MKIFYLIGLIGLIGLGCMTSAMVVDDVVPTVTVSGVITVEGEVRDEGMWWVDEPKQFEVCVDALHVRSGPRYEASVLGYLYRGDVVTVTEYFDGWGMIEPARWVRLKFLC